MGSLIGIILICTLAIPAGYLLARTTKKEVKEGRKYLLFSQKILLAIILALTAYGFRTSNIAVAGIAVIIFAAIAFQLNYYFTIAILAVSFSFGGTIVQNIVFLELLLTGSLAKNAKQAFIAAIWFFAIAGALSLILP